MTAPDAPVVIRAWRERPDGTRYDGQMAWVPFRDLPARIERYWRQRRYALAFWKADHDAAGEDAIEIARVCKDEDTGHWVWWSDSPEATDTTGEPGRSVAGSEQAL